MKKLLSKLMVLLLAAVFCMGCIGLAGCRGGSTPNEDWGDDEPPATQEDPVTLRVMHYRIFYVRLQQHDERAEYGVVGRYDARRILLLVAPDERYFD